MENPTYHLGRVLIAQYIDPIKLSLFKGLRTGIIKSVLECDVEIVSLVEENHQYAATSYEIKVVQFPKPLGV